MTPAITIRAATPADLDHLVELVRLYYTYDGIGFEGERVRPALAELLATPVYGRVWLASSPGAPAGYIVATFGFDHEHGGRTALVTDLYVCDGFRRQGLGTRLLEHAAAEMHALGARALELQVERDNTEARALYDKHGLHPHDRVPMTKLLG